MYYLQTKLPQEKKWQMELNPSTCRLWRFKTRDDAKKKMEKVLEKWDEVFPVGPRKKGRVKYFEEAPENITNSNILYIPQIWDEDTGWCDWTVDGDGPFLYFDRKEAIHWINEWCDNEPNKARLRSFKLTQRGISYKRNSTRW